MDDAALTALRHRLENARRSAVCSPPGVRLALPAEDVADLIGAVQYLLQRDRA